MTSMNVPEPVMSLAVQPVSKDSGGQVTYVNFEAETTTYFSFNSGFTKFATEIYFPVLVLESTESIPERGSYFPCGFGSREWPGII